MITANKGKDDDLSQHLAADFCYSAGRKLY